ncbi:MAG: preprotein translocase subunit YajC [Clostridia bacterium]|nr:preprotein translocase subunit YajC [Clostridia bacterium]
MLLMLVGIVVLFYFFMIRPQRKQENEVKNMRDNLVVGDEITTIGGIIGKIVSIKEETCMIETGRDKTRIRILKSAVRCVDVPNEAARELLAKQRAEEAEKEAAERAEKEEAARKARLENAQSGKKGKKAKTETVDVEETPSDESSAE